MNQTSSGVVAMETLTDTPLLKFNPDTLKDVRRALNVHQEGVLDQMIDSFEDWILKQNHFTKKTFDRHYLETSIILGKGSLERAKNTMDKLCTLKTLLPHFFSKHDAKNELINTSGFVYILLPLLVLAQWSKLHHNSFKFERGPDGTVLLGLSVRKFSAAAGSASIRIQATMPKLLKDNYRLYIIKIVSADFDSAMLLDFHRFAVLMSEYVKSFDYCLGFACVIDCRDVNLINVVTKINILDLRNSMSVLMEGYSLRLKAIHLISSSKAIDAFVTLLKQVVSAKIADRINVHKTEESLYEIIPKDAWPEDYGGDERPLKDIYEHWVSVLSEKDNVALFKDICSAGTDEKYRLTENYNTQILGMPGSFRTLTVD